MSGNSRVLMDGVLVIDKPEGISSSDVCLRVKRALQARKAGHLGTLDPLATGVLPVCLNQATKLVQFLMHQNKVYEAEMELGAETDTQDCQGTVVRQAALDGITPERVMAALGTFRGCQQQLPPMYSALKRNGVPLYRLARRGEQVERPARSITIDRLVVDAIMLPRVRIHVACSAGTYIRTLCHDIGRALGCGAHMTALRRVRSGPFAIADAVPLADILAEGGREMVRQRLIGNTAALAGLPSVTVDDATARRVRNGAQICDGDIVDMQHRDLAPGTPLCVLDPDRALVAVAQLRESADAGAPACKTLRVFLDA